VALDHEVGTQRLLGTGVEYPVRLAVRDNGPGIDPETAGHVFDPFFTTKESGSGLGLAVVHRAVEAHQGVTYLDRAPEGGAQFVMFLPGIPGETAVADT
jgi:signal transduction histidine kinase